MRRKESIKTDYVAGRFLTLQQQVCNWLREQQTWSACMDRSRLVWSAWPYRRGMRVEVRGTWTPGGLDASQLWSRCHLATLAQ